MVVEIVVHDDTIVNLQVKHKQQLLPSSLFFGDELYILKLSNSTFKILLLLVSLRNLAFFKKRLQLISSHWSFIMSGIVTLGVTIFSHPIDGNDVQRGEREGEKCVHQRSQTQQVATSELPLPRLPQNTTYIIKLSIEKQNTCRDTIVLVLDKAKRPLFTKPLKYRVSTP